MAEKRIPPEHHDTHLLPELGTLAFREDQREADTSTVSVVMTMGRKRASRPL